MCHHCGLVARARLGATYLPSASHCLTHWWGRTTLDPPSLFACLPRGEAGRTLLQIKFLPRGEGINVYVEREILNHSVLLHPQYDPAVRVLALPYVPSCLRVTWCPHALLSRCTSIIQFREVFLTPDYLAIAMEFAPGGDMFQYVKKKKGLQARRCAPPCRLLCCDLCGCLGLRRSRAHLRQDLDWGPSCLGAPRRSTRRGGSSSS